MNYEVLKRNFENHGFHTSYFETAEEAADYVAGQIKGRRVGIGGCMTAKEMGLYERLKEENQVWWHWMEPGRETLNHAREAEIYLCSANGVSETGELVNIDGTGNRIAMTVFGPEKVLFLIGRNKVAPNLEQAIYRAKNVAGPRNAIRFQKKTPCAQNGGDRCYDCNSPDRICKATVILERPCNGMEVEIIFINKDLGY